MLSKSFKAQELLGFRISDFTQAKHFGCQEICFPCRDEYLKGPWLPRSRLQPCSAPGKKRIHKEKAKSSEAKFGRRHCLAMTLGDLLPKTWRRQWIASMSLVLKDPDLRTAKIEDPIVIDTP